MKSETKAAPKSYPKLTSSFQPTTAHNRRVHCCSAPKLESKLRLLDIFFFSLFYKVRKSSKKKWNRWDKWHENREKQPEMSQIWGGECCCCVPPVDKPANWRGWGRLRETSHHPHRVRSRKFFLRSVSRNFTLLTVISIISSTTTTTTISAIFHPSKMNIFHDHLTRRHSGFRRQKRERWLLSLLMIIMISRMRWHWACVGTNF